MFEPPARLVTALTGRYRIIRELGAGGMATVYLAEDTKHRRQVAVKMLRPEVAANLGAERFLREIEIAAGLHHPHILPLYDSGGTEDALFYVMPFIDGQSLRDRLTKAGALPIDEAVRIIREVADALEHSHQHGLVHRDIKPENILLTGAHAVVTDFGVAKAVSDATGSGSLTVTGMALGTPTYMAPEQATADPALDHRVDIYALGVMAYEIIAGRPPFMGTNQQQILAGHLAQRPDALSIHRNAVPPALEAVVMRCLEKNPADRWQTAGEMLRALEAIPAATSGATAATAAAISASSVAGSAAAMPTRRRSYRLIGGAIAALVVAAAGIAWFVQVGRAGTLIGDDVLAENDLVLVSEFRNGTPDSSLAATVTDAMRVELQQSRVVQVMTQSAMWAGLQRMGLGHATALPDSQVRELAEREGAKAFVVGNIATLGGGYQLTAQVIATTGGSVALTERVTAADETKLIGAVEELGRALRRGIGESLRSVQNATPLAQVTTASLPALRAYTASVRAELDGDRRRGIELAKQALAIDSNFAGAWGALFVMYGNNGRVQLASEAATRAYHLRDRLPEWERLRTIARYHGLRGESAEEEAAWMQLVAMGRDEISYADFLLNERRFAEAERMARQGIVSLPKSPIGYYNLVEAQVAQQRFAAAESTVAEFGQALPNHPFWYGLTASIALGRRDFDAVEVYLRTLDEQRLSPPMRRDKCLVELQRARLRAWQTCNERFPAGLSQARLLGALAEFRMIGDVERARHVYDPFLVARPESRNTDLYGVTIALLAEVGRVADARSLLEAWRTHVGPNDPGYLADSAWAVGSIAAAEQQWDRAVTAFLAWNASPMPTSMHLYNRGFAEAARALERLGKPDSAIVLLERALAVPSIAGGPRYEITWYAQGLQQLGELHEARGDRAKATEYYARYLQLLKDAEPPMSAQVSAVRAKYERLTSEPRR
jgi:tRNA A-37 threonylcarbamoyl transferase component Bud32/tetratricopeptide (TPR) repeat protein